MHKPIKVFILFFFFWVSNVLFTAPTQYYFQNKYVFLNWRCYVIEMTMWATFFWSDHVWLHGWVLICFIVYRRICHWSRPEIFGGRRGLGRRWKYENNLTRKYEILLIIVYIAKKKKTKNMRSEPNRSGLNSWKHLHQRQQCILPCREEGWSELNFCFDQAQRHNPKFPPSEEGEGGWWWWWGGRENRGATSLKPLIQHIC